MAKKSSSKRAENIEESVQEQNKPSSASKMKINKIKKKSSSKTPSKKTGNKEESVLEQNKPSLASKSSNNEIDEIFAGKKRKSEPESTNKPNGDEISRPKSLKKIKKSKETKVEKSFNESSSRSRKKTGDGLAIYTEEELGFNKSDAGNTSLCPFDCDCCF